MTLGAISPEFWVPAAFNAQYTAPGLPAIPLQMQAEIRTSADFSLIDVRALQLSALDLNVSGELSLVQIHFRSWGNSTSIPLMPRRWPSVSA